MERFEGYWSLQPLFVDKESCFPENPQTLADYEHCTRGKGRVATVVRLEQLVQPSIIPPPPISWYVRGITSKTTELLIQDLLAETAKLRNSINNKQEIAISNNISLDEEESIDLDDDPIYYFDDIKKKWHCRKR